MSWFKCSVCAEKDLRISELKEQNAKHIEDLKVMCAVQSRLLKDATSKTDSRYHMAVDSEMNLALEGGGPQVSLTEEQEKEMSAVERQALELLTGTYN